MHAEMFNQNQKYESEITNSRARKSTVELKYSNPQNIPNIWNLEESTTLKN